MMSATDQTSNNGCSKRNSDLLVSPKKPSNKAVKKFTKKYIYKSKDLNNSESNFERCKKLGLLKRNIAQDRLKRIRSNVNPIKTVNEKIEKFQESGKSGTQRPKKFEVLKKAFLSDNINIKRYEHDSSRAKKYSADSRLKKIRAVTNKSAVLDEYIENSPDNNDSHVPTSIWKTTHWKNEIKRSSPSEISPPKYLKSEVRNKSPEIFAEFDNKTAERTSGSYSNAADKLLVGNDMSMDVDVDECINSDLLDKNLSSSKNLSPALKNQFHDHEDWLNVKESDVIFVNEEVSKIRKESMYLALHESFMSDIEMDLALPFGDLFIVVDTNIFLSHLYFLQKLLKYEIPPYRSPVIVVPWLVIQEIDYAMKKDNPRLSSQARLANKFIYDCLKKKLPRFFGQSLQDFKENFKNAVCVDDYILQYCLKFVSLKNEVILLTDDINLCNKCMVNQLTVFTKKEFEKSYKFVIDS